MLYWICDATEHVVDKIYSILIPIKQKTINKINENLKKNPNKLNLIKAASPYINVHTTFEKTFSTCLGNSLQEVAAVCGKNVINLDNSGKKILGIDLRIDFGDGLGISEGQLKSSVNTQTSTYRKDALNKLIFTTSQNLTKPFFATAFGKSYEYTKDGIVFMGGKMFWEKIGINYDELYDTTLKVIRETSEYVESVIIPTI